MSRILNAKHFVGDMGKAGQGQDLIHETSIGMIEDSSGIKLVTINIDLHGISHLLS